MLHDFATVVKMGYLVQSGVFTFCMTWMTYWMEVDGTGFLTANSVILGLSLLTSIVCVWLLARLKTRDPEASVPMLVWSTLGGGLQIVGFLAFWVLFAWSLD